MTHTKVLATAFAALGVVGLTAVGAGADPVNAKKGEVLAINCDAGLGALEVAVNGNGAFTPGMVTTSTQVGIPYEVHIVGTFTPTGGAPMPFRDDAVKKAPRNGRLATCTFNQTDTSPEGVATISGTVKISFTPVH
jgi:hypothetical protein